MSLRKKWLFGGILPGLLCFLVWTVACVWQDIRLSYPRGRSPSTPEETVVVTYTIPDTNGTWVQTSWSIAGYVERIRLEETTDIPLHGFVDLKIKTTEGWYESPRCSLGGPVDWEKGVTMTFEYPKGMKLREKTAGFGGPIHQVLGLDWGAGGGMGCPPIDGDVGEVHLQKSKDGEGFAFTAKRTTGLRHFGSAGSIAIVRIFEFFFAEKQGDLIRGNFKD